MTPFSSNLAILICTDAWSLAWMRRPVAELFALPFSIDSEKHRALERGEKRERLPLARNVQVYDFFEFVLHCVYMVDGWVGCGGGKDAWCNE